MSKFSSFKSHQLITESWRKFLKEDEGVVTYNISRDALDNREPLESAVQITLPSGEPVSLTTVVQGLDGQELVDPDDGEKFVFSLDVWEGEDLEDKAYDVASNGPVDWYIEEWAKLQDLEAQDAGFGQRHL